MNSSNQLPTQPFDKNVNLKVLYTFDDRNTFLARSIKPITAKIITLPSQPPHNGAQIGCVELKRCLDLLHSVSPEWFQKGMDYSIYFKDIIESGEPYVGSGLYSKIIKDKKSNILITGRLCANVLNLYQGNSSADTLDIKLKLSPITNNNSNSTTFVNSNKRKQGDMFSMYNQNNSSSSPCNNSDELIDQSTQMHLHQQNQLQNQTQPRKRVKKTSHTINNNIITKNLETISDKSNRVNNHSNNQNNQNNQNFIINNLPQLASRTQSLPFITEDSLAHRIRVSDMIPSKIEEEVDARGEPISSRFLNFQKSSKNETDSQPTRAKKSKSFIQSVVKIGDNAVGSKTKKSTLASTANSSKRCVNCMSISNPPYKFHKDGIFELANSGYLCSTCNFYQTKNEVKLLRERGELGLKGLLDVPYTKISNSKRNKRKQNGTNSQANSSVIENSSSPLPTSSSSPMNLQNGFGSKSRRQHNSNNIIGFQKPDTVHELDIFTQDDFTSLLKLESGFSTLKGINSHDPQPVTELDPVEDIFTIPNNKYPVPGPLSTSSSASIKGQSKNNTPGVNIEDYYNDFDNVPIDATKLNTTLIPLDDDDKENLQPTIMPPPNFNTYNFSKEKINVNDASTKDHMNPLLVTEISPSIQRIIESFSNEPSSPTKTTNNDWNYNFFEEPSSQTGNHNSECDDPEINRILAHNEKYDITPRDPETVQTQQNGDSPVTIKLTPVNPSMNLNMSCTAKSRADNINDLGTNNNIDNNSAKLDNNNTNSGTNNEASSTKKTRLTMPSSPFFNIHNDDLDKDDKTLDTTASLMNWDAKSSPVTEPLSSAGDKLLSL